MGRASTYTQKIADEICGELVAGNSLVKICAADGMPSRETVFKWLAANRQFADNYARSREGWADAVFDELFEIADDGKNDWMERHGEDNPGWQFNGEHAQRTRIRIDTRKWALARMSPKKYGDKMVNELTGPDGAPLHNEEALDKKLAALVAVVKRRVAQPELSDASDLA